MTRSSGLLAERKTQAILLLLTILASPATAADFFGRVVNIVDGDTLTVLASKNQIRVRLDGIDAPERNQAFGKRSRQSLVDICSGKEAHEAS